MKKTSKLRQLLERDEVLILPGCYDALGARIIQVAGFDAAYMSGNSTAASMLGMPDIGLITATEVIWRAHQIASVIDIPLVCDADTGYGNLHNVMRTVREFEAAGVAGIHIEDQVTPKRCGTMAGVQVISLEEALTKLKAALNAREDPDFVIIARTDARNAIDMEEAIKRATAFFKAGVDAVYISGARSFEEIQEVARKLKGVPKLFSVVDWHPWTHLSLNEIKGLGFKVAWYPMSLTLIIAEAMMNFAEHLKQNGSTQGLLHMMADFHKDYDEKILGLTRYDQIEAKIIGKTMPGGSR